MVGAQYEYYQMIKHTGIKPQTITGIIAGVVAYLLSTVIASGLLPMDYLVLVVPALVVIMIIELYRSRISHFNRWPILFFRYAMLLFLYHFFPFQLFWRRVSIL